MIHHGGSVVSVKVYGGMRNCPHLDHFQIVCLPVEGPALHFSVFGFWFSPYLKGTINVSEAVLVMVAALPATISRMLQVEVF